MWIKIEEDIFYISNISVQFTIMSHANISIDIDIFKYPEYSTYFLHKYENWQTFSFKNNKVVASGCIIKSIDMQFNKKLTLLIVSDVVGTDVLERREDILNRILNEKQ